MYESVALCSIKSNIVYSNVTQYILMFLFYQESKQSQFLSLWLSDNLHVNYLFTFYCLLQNLMHFL